MKALRISPVDKIVRISKSENGDESVIFLTDASVIRVKDSVNTLEARLNAKDDE